ncbi:hypothetical protein A9Q86_11875 [Flavobacteriales bacterium 33_180_T64]|nr:hypothetical protein A9Q86_11875 [Flavobacteriales bacterium 33_180_T64]
MKEIKRYDLHKDDYSKLHFELNNAKTYVDKNRMHASIPHRHSFYQIIWFKKSGRHYIDYNIIDHPDNTVFFINKNQIHYFCKDSVNEGYLFHFNDEFITKYNPQILERFSTSIFNEIGNSHITLSELDSKKVGLITAFIESELQLKESNYREQSYHHFQTILFLIERLRNKAYNLNHETNADFALAAAFKKLIFKRINDFYSIDNYAITLNTNSKTLTAISKTYLLDTPANIIKESKLLEAKRMLSNQNISIKEVAYALGFDDPTYFTKYFKKGTSYTPRAFQKAYL